MEKKSLIIYCILSIYPCVYAMEGNDDCDSNGYAVTVDSDGSVEITPEKTSCISFSSDMIIHVDPPSYPEFKDSSCFGNRLPKRAAIKTEIRHISSHNHLNVFPFLISGYNYNSQRHPGNGSDEEESDDSLHDSQEKNSE